MSGTPEPIAAMRLSEHRFFRGMGEAFLSRVTKMTHERAFETGDLLLREGDLADEFLLIFSGKVALEVVFPGRPRTTIQTLGPGEVVGWSWLIPPYRAHLDARALKPTQALGISAAHLRSALNDDPSEAYRLLLRLLPVIAERLENTQLQLLDLHGP